MLFPPCARGPCISEIQILTLGEPFPPARARWCAPQPLGLRVRLAHPFCPIAGTPFPPPETAAGGVNACRFCGRKARRNAAARRVVSTAASFALRPQRLCRPDLSSPRIARAITSFGFNGCFSALTPQNTSVPEFSSGEPVLYALLPKNAHFVCYPDRSIRVLLTRAPHCVAHLHPLW